MADGVDVPPPGQGVPEYRRYGAGVNGISHEVIIVRRALHYHGKV